jgi:uncharacterized Fe-S cluster protein YjdI
MKDIVKNYTNGEVTVVWKPSLCIHSAKCWRGENSLPEVFNPAERPWIKPEGATTERIIEQIKRCPSGALSYYMNNEGVKEVEVTSETIAEVALNGPLLVYGNLKIKNADGSETKKSQVTAFCRCGQSGNKPFCDGTHKKIGFEG